MLRRSRSVLLAMIDRYAWYRVAFPFRTKTQRKLRQDREGESLDSFTKSLEEGPCRDIVASFLWKLIRDELAFIPDFKPAANDSFSKIYGLYTDDLQDDILDPLTSQCGIDMSGMDFRGQDLSLIDTPAEVNRFVSRPATSQ